MSTSHLLLKMIFFKHFGYIENTLLNPDAANTLEAEIGDKLASLNIYPHRFPIPNDPFFKTAVIRFIVIKSI